MFICARTRTHVEALLLPCLAVNPTGLTERNSELVNGFYIDSWYVFMINNLQVNIYYISRRENADIFIEVSQMFQVFQMFLMSLCLMVIIYLVPPPPSMQPQESQGGMLTIPLLEQFCGCHQENSEKVMGLLILEGGMFLIELDKAEKNFL